MPLKLEWSRLIIPAVTFLLFIYLSTSSIWPDMWCRNLDDVDLKKSFFARKMADKFLPGKDIKFRVDYGLFSLSLIVGNIASMTYPDKVYISPYFLNCEYFDFLIAHELGHFYYEHESSSSERLLRKELEADKFAVLVCGKERVLEALKTFSRSWWVESEELEKRIAALDLKQPNP